MLVLFGPSHAALCSGQAAFKHSRSRGSRLQTKPVWKTPGEMELERRTGTAPCPALPKTGRAQEQGCRSLWGSVIPICQTEGDGSSSDAQEASKACFEPAACSPPRWDTDVGMGSRGKLLQGQLCGEALGLAISLGREALSPSKRRSCWSPWVIVLATQRLDARCQILMRSG